MVILHTIMRKLIYSLLTGCLNSARVLNSSCHCPASHLQPLAQELTVSINLRTQYHLVTNSLFLPQTETLVSFQTLPPASCYSFLGSAFYSLCCLSQTLPSNIPACLALIFLISAFFSPASTFLAAHSCPPDCSASHMISPTVSSRLSSTSYALSSLCFH